MRSDIESRVCVIEPLALAEVRTDNGDSGTLFPFGPAVRFPCDEHRREYTHADALAVAEMVNESSWLTRVGR